MWMVQGAALTVLLAGVLAVYALVANPPEWVMWVGTSALVVVLVAVVVVLPVVRYRVHRWEVTQDAVYTQTGLLTVEQRIAPLSRVQTVDTERDVLARLFGLSTVVVTTASARGALHIPGLERAQATAVVDQLTRITAAGSGDAT